ncbi:MAG: hypothetical protein QOJ16_4292 [Acidobacteriota bacterium]|jgi:hypothetical protein|nr:hypothetical protein [Acidobacteriota bacterium]
MDMQAPRRSHHEGRAAAEVLREGRLASRKGYT